ncbi:MAG: SIMPL domain-containing protein [Candidatus Melainabacteria bacterium]|nr:SIMPL domain-containing protein [Candidatus Melainabacteria bacterium]
MKNNILILIFLILVLSSLSFSKAFAETDLSTLNVTGSGQSNAKPDQASLSIGVITKGKTASEAASLNAASAQKLIDALTRLGIADKDVQTSNISITPLYKAALPADEIDNKIIGYQATNEIQATIHMIGDVGKIVDTVVFTGNYTIHGVNFSLEKSDDFQSDALKKAVSDAKRKADIVASAAGKTITGVKNISIGGSIMPFGKAEFAGAQAQDFSTPILPGELTVSESVSVEYILDNK